MHQYRFRPRVEGMEDRLTPAATPDDVFTAAALVQRTHDTLDGLSAFLGEPMNVYEREFWPSVLPSLVAESQRAAAVLSEFGSSLRAEAAADTARAETLLAYFTRTKELEAQAHANAVGAVNMATGFFGVPLSTVLPPPPPPPPAPAPFPDAPPFPDTPGEPPVTPPTQDPEGMTATFPSLAAPEWQAFGDKGLRTWDVTVGVGEEVEPGAQVTVYYRGWLAATGAEFETNTTQPADQLQPFSLLQVIEGWQLGVPGMRPGGIRRLDIPAELAYGAQGSPPSIPPNSRLVFEIKLLEVDNF